MAVYISYVYLVNFCVDYPLISLVYEIFANDSETDKGTLLR